MKQTEVTFKDVETGETITVLITGDMEEQDELDVKVTSSTPLKIAIETQLGRLMGLFMDQLGDIVK